MCVARPGVTLLAAALAMLTVLAPAQAGAEDPTWREVDPDNLVFVDLAEGEVVIELNPLFAPKTVGQFRRLVRERFYDGLAFYRVIDGFVAQGGDGSDLGELSNVPLIEAEFERDWVDELPFTAVQKPDLFAAETGFIDGFAAGRDLAAGKTWLLHCPGAVAMARNDGADSSRTDFYIVIGQAPRYLDRNMNVFGRIIHAWRRYSESGADRPATTALSATTPRPHPRPRYRLRYSRGERRESRMDTGSEGFADLLDDRRERKQRFSITSRPRCSTPARFRWRGGWQSDGFAHTGRRHRRHQCPLRRRRDRRPGAGGGGRAGDLSDLVGVHRFLRRPARALHATPAAGQSRTRAVRRPGDRHRRRRQRTPGHAAQHLLGH
jgi:peptidylprolyl isomerase